jgi:hypothetical protein
MDSWYKYSSLLLYKIKVLKQMSKWTTPKYIDLRLYTMYGSHYISYIIKHPILFTRDLNRYIEWCIMMDKHR